MARHASVTAHQVNQAEVEGAIAGYFGVPATTPGISDLVRVVFPGVEAASRQNPAGWRSVVLSVLANHIGLARGLGLAGSELQRQLDIMRHSNRTSADFAQALGRVQVLVAGMGGWSRLAAAVEGGERSPTSADYAYMANGGPYAADRLPSEMRRWVGDGCDAHHVARVGNYLHDLGINAHQYTGFFVGSSETVRQAIRDHIRNGQALTDEHVTNANDARAIMGAIRAGRIKLEDAPPSVRRLMERMEREGIDPSRADPSQIQQFFERNPNALNEARQANAATELRAVGQTDAEVHARAQDVAQRRGATTIVPVPTAIPPQGPDRPEEPAQPAPRVVAGTLDLG